MPEEHNRLDRYQQQGPLRVVVEWLYGGLQIRVDASSSLVYASIFTES